MKIPSEPMTVSALADAAGCSRTTMQERVRRLGLRSAGFVKELHQGRTCKAAVYLPDKRLFQFTLKQMRAEGLVPTRDVMDKVGTNAEVCRAFLESLGLEPVRNGFYVMWRVPMTDAELADKLELHNRWRRGEFGKMPLSPKELGEVMDEVIRRLREKGGEMSEPKRPMRRYCLTEFTA